jgi:hypothetical protein
MNILAAANYFLDKTESVSKSKIEFSDGKTYSVKEFKGLLNVDLMLELDCKDYFNQNESEKTAFVRDVFKKIDSLILSENLKERRHIEGLPDIDLDFSNYIPILDASTSSVVMFDKGLNDINKGFSFEAFKMLLPNEEKKYLSTIIRPGQFVYDPYNLETLIPVTIGAQEFIKVNLYNPPKWRLRDAPSEVKCPEIVDKFLHHLFPTQEQVEFILDWAYLALVERSEVYIVLNGRKGIGKGLFTSLIKAVVGSDNFTEGPASILNTQFNALLETNRVISFDELKIGKKEHLTLKKIINKHQTIEKKGQDAQRNKETYNSFIISNNDETDVHVEPDDRRFAVMELTENNLRDVWDHDLISDFSYRLENDEELAYQFGYFIYERGMNRKIDPFRVFIGEKFHKLCYTSLAVWQRYIVDTILSREEEEYLVSKLRREAKKEHIAFPTSKNKISDFLNNYRHEGKYLLGEYIFEPRNSNIRVSEHFLPEEYKEGSDPLAGFGQIIYEDDEDEVEL